MMKQNQIIITSGEYRGRKITTPATGTHPMGSREKLALFNMLGEKVRGAVVLDAFAGSGALGIEALSRGASYAVFLEKSPQAITVIRQNLAALNLQGKAEVERADIGKQEINLLNLAKNHHATTNFDIIIADPPYDLYIDKMVLPLVQLLDRGGILALSHPQMAPELPGLVCLKTRTYAKAHLSFYKMA